METLKNYLENMFLNLPNTPEVRKAKNELLQMMEDKYTELKAEGRAENEVIGIVISEFGNLDELAEELGIKTYVEEEMAPDQMLSLEETKDFLKDTVKRSYLIALGVMFCILSPVPVIFLDAIVINEKSDFALAKASMIGAILMFLIIAIGVAFFIFAGTMKQKWQQIERNTVGIDFNVTAYTKKQFESVRGSHALCLSLGCMLCILSFIPAFIIDTIFPTDFWYECSGAFLFILVAVGVYLIVFTSNRNKGYQALFALNARGTMGNTHVPESAKEVEYINETVRSVMNVYWQTVTCIYLCVSFLTFNWEITWIIWPVAAVIQSILKTNFQKL
ncbi:MAG: permease prefix domain 1-containing protein [Lachnospiraceae bacterium]|nr:permease prefix domain 1-containing protein [Lachnospiraceae bacterium]